MKNNYLFTSERLGFRNWVESDIAEMHKVSSDPMVMEFFPKTNTMEETAFFVKRMQEQFDATGYCYFAVDKLEDGAFIGFIGMYDQTYEAPFTPCVDIGWRLAQKAWGFGYATEGAKRCLEWAFEKTSVNDIKSICVISNVKSERVMQKIGMTKVKTFEHSELLDYPHLKDCVWYEIKG